jgi:hypothetical protein
MAGKAMRFGLLKEGGTASAAIAIPTVMEHMKKASRIFLKLFP